MLPSQRRPEPGLLRRGPKADEAPLADDDRATAAAEQTQQSIEMHPALIGGDPDSEIEQHGIQRPLPRLRAPRPVNVRLAKLGIAGNAARLRINDPAGEQRDDGAACTHRSCSRQPCTVQTTTWAKRQPLRKCGRASLSRQRGQYCSTGRGRPRRSDRLPDSRNRPSRSRASSTRPAAVSCGDAADTDSIPPDRCSNVWPDRCAKRRTVAGATSRSTSSSIVPRTSRAKRRGGTPAATAARQSQLLKSSSVRRLGRCGHIVGCLVGVRFSRAMSADPTSVTSLRAWGRAEDARGPNHLLVPSRSAAMESTPLSSISRRNARIRARVSGSCVGSQASAARDNRASVPPSWSGFRDIL